MLFYQAGLAHKNSSYYLLYMSHQLWEFSSCACRARQIWVDFCELKTQKLTSDPLLCQQNYSSDLISDKVLNELEERATSNMWSTQHTQHARHCVGCPHHASQIHHRWWMVLRNFSTKELFMNFKYRERLILNSIDLNIQLNMELSPTRKLRRFARGE